MEAAAPTLPMVELVPSALRCPPRTASGSNASRNRTHRSYPRATARINSSPELPAFSAMARAAGATEQPGWDLVTGSKSSVSSAWPNIPLPSAALTADVLMSLASNDASGVPPCKPMYLMVISPGFSRAPETTAARLSRILCLAARATSGGRLRSRAPTM